MHVVCPCLVACISPMHLTAQLSATKFTILPPSSQVRSTCLKKTFLFVIKADYRIIWPYKKLPPALGLLFRLSLLTTFTVVKHCLLHMKDYFYVVHSISKKLQSYYHPFTSEAKEKMYFSMTHQRYMRLLTPLQTA